MSLVKRGISIQPVRENQMAPPEALIGNGVSFFDPSANDVCGAFQSTHWPALAGERPAKPGIPATWEFENCGG